MLRFAIVYILAGLIQMPAYLEGTNRLFDIGPFFSLLAFAVLYPIPLLGALWVSGMTYYGALNGWQWEWWKALAMAAPAMVVLMLFPMNRK